MIFGEIPVDEAEGCVLAHSLLVGGVRWPKGRVLQAADLDALRGTGITSVVAARLEPGDVSEDAAATHIGAAVAGGGLTFSTATTGRINLHAAANGLVVIDTAGVNRLNAVAEAVTLATVAPFQPVAVGTMVATIKIIPFAVPAAVLTACLPPSPLLRVAPWRGLKAGLLQTRVAGTKDSVLAKTTEATARRLEACGATLVSEDRCPHRTADVAVALKTLRASGCDLVLMVGASAISDRADVLPSAVVDVGGRIDHLGMPVDPGNLLMLAEWDGLPVLGLPGCARSPKLNGADWVLWRLAAGLPVTRADIMGMGVGGLIADVPGRPMPRARASANVGRS